MNNSSSSLWATQIRDHEHIHAENKISRITPRENTSAYDPQFIRPIKSRLQLWIDNLWHHS